MFDIVYHYPETSSNFDIGNELQIIGIILAFYIWLKGPRLAFLSLQINSWKSSLIPFPLILGYIFSLIGWNSYIASSCVLLTPILLIFWTMKRKLFKRNPQKFYDEIIKELAKGSPENVSAALEVLMGNFEDICLALKKPNSTAKIAKDILLVIFTENEIVKILTTKRLDQLFVFFQTIENQDVVFDELKLCISRIIPNLLLDSDSFFYKYLEHYGLAFSANIYNLIYGSSYVVKNFNICTDPRLAYLKEFKIEKFGIKVFLRAFSEMLTTCQRNSDIPLTHITCGFRYICKLFKELCIMDVKYTKKNDIGSELNDELYCLYLLADFLGNLEPTKNSSTQSEENISKTINENIADSISEAFERLSYIEKSSRIDWISQLLLHGIESNYQKTIGYHILFEEKIWKIIYKNTTQRLYPAGVKPYLSIYVPRMIPDAVPSNAWMTGQIKKLRKYLYNDLKPLLEKKAIMVDQKSMEKALLPDCLCFENGYFFYLDHRQLKVQISPPLSPLEHFLQTNWLKKAP